MKEVPHDSLSLGQILCMKGNSGVVIEKAITSGFNWVAV